ncbi:MAG: tRNA uridine-5-carboxymethylaminomethyl(34) synthesis GTPase MnmE [Oscillospiraceae bacterium]|nr:tRNA uridine-5-carboxymethylaminomethyl(34) synthesis GTPase MnmE [Oscillospiraceae bacterium]
MSTIAAIATPAGTGGIAVIRISGPEALAVADKMCLRFAQGKKVSDVAGGRTARVKILDEENAALDDGIVTVFREPASYTGEDVAEISCHGGSYVTKAVLRSALAHGAAPAGPGEFTKRAFLNGKLSLTQAEAVMNLISAGGKSSAKAALSLLEGSLSAELRKIRDQLTDTASHLSAWIDFPEEDVEEVSPDVLGAALGSAQSSVAALVADYDRGRLVSEGIDAVICGRPNVGKSTLMNLLAGCEKSIVADIPGTTRDIVEETVVIGGCTMRLSDTAGLRDTGDVVESIGVDKAKKRIGQADLILAVFEGSEQPEKADLDLIKELADKKYIAVVNKSDLGQKLSPELFEAAQATVFISAKNGDGAEELREEILKALELDEFDASAPLLAGERQLYCARRALDAITEAKAALESGMTLDAVWVCVQAAITALCELDGKNADESIIEGVFRNFCVGK